MYTEGVLESINKDLKNEQEISSKKMLLLAQVFPYLLKLYKNKRLEATLV